MKLLLFIPSLFINSLLYADMHIPDDYGLDIVHPEKGEFLLEGEFLVGGSLFHRIGESCKFTMKTKGKITNTDCTYFVNSKNIDILCTPKKAMCKTITEINAFVKKETQPFLEDIKGYSYSKARKIIIKAGYTPIKSTIFPTDIHKKRIYDKGYVEVSFCYNSSYGSSTKRETLSCQLRFQANNGRELIVDIDGDIPVVSAFFYTSLAQ